MTIITFRSCCYLEMNNSTKEPVDDDFSKPWKTCINTCILIFGLSGNLLLVTLMIRVKRLRQSITNLLILNLALCDFTVVGTSISFELVEINEGYFRFGNIGCRIIYPLSTFAVIAVVLTLIVLSWERYIAVVYPFKYHKVKRKGVQLIMCIHFIAFCSTLPYATSLHVKNNNGVLICEEGWSTQSSGIYTIFLVIIQYGIPLPIMITLYSMTWYRIKQQNDDVIRVCEQQRRRAGPINKEELINAKLELMKTYEDAKKRSKLFGSIRHQRSRSYSTQLAVVRQQQTVSMLKTFIIIVTVFAVFMLPNQLTWLIQTVANTTLSSTWISISYWLTYANSIWNPIIYGFNAKFRRAYIKHLLTCLKVCCRNAGGNRRFGSAFSYARDTTSSSSGMVDSKRAQRKAFFRNRINTSLTSIDTNSLRQTFDSNSLYSTNRKHFKTSLSSFDSISVDSFIYSPICMRKYVQESSVPVLSQRCNNVFNSIQARNSNHVATEGLIPDDDVFKTDMRKRTKNSYKRTKVYGHVVKAANRYVEFQLSKSETRGPALHRLYKSALRNSLYQKYGGDASCLDKTTMAVNTAFASDLTLSAVLCIDNNNCLSKIYEETSYGRNTEETSYDSDEGSPGSGTTSEQSCDINIRTPHISIYDEDDNEKDEHSDEINNVDIADVELEKDRLRVDCLVDGRRVSLVFDTKLLEKLQFIKETEI